MADDEIKGQKRTEQKRGHTDATKAILGRLSRAMWSNPETREKVIAAQNAGKAKSEAFKAARRTMWTDERRQAMAARKPSSLPTLI